MMAGQIENFGPGPKYVYKVLDYEGPLTYGEIIEETGLPESTVKRAVRRLRERGLIESETVYDDLRKKRYRRVEKAG